VWVGKLQIELVGTETLADTMASGSRYAAHDIGGITRKMYIMAVPDVSIADVNYTTTVDADSGTATVGVMVTVANDAVAASASDGTSSGSVTLTLCKRGPPTAAHLRPLAATNCTGCRPLPPSSFGTTIARQRVAGL
jgi:hypothetical protein